MSSGADAHSRRADAWQPVVSHDATSLALQRFDPPSPLSAFITSYWLYQSGPLPHARERLLPTGIAQLVIDLSGDGFSLPDLLPDPLPVGVSTTDSGVEPHNESHRTTHAVLHGPYTRPFLLGTDRPVWRLGVNFAPVGVSRFFRLPASDLQDADVPLDALWGTRAAEELGERLAQARRPAEQFGVLERLLRRQLMRFPAPHPAVGHAVRAFSTTPRGGALDHRVRVASVAEEAGLSVGGLTRLFKEEVGLTPKRYIRIQRFLRVLRRTRKGRPAPWARLAVEGGYYDQAHLINEFHALAGVSPCVYLRDRSERSPTDLIVVE